MGNQLFLQSQEGKLKEIEMTNHAEKCISDLGYEIFEKDNTRIIFKYKDNLIVHYGYTGWHQGKGIKPGRGLKNLLNQLK